MPSFPDERYIDLANATYLRFASISHPIVRTQAVAHTAMVDAYMTLLCEKRGISRELGKIAALLHDIGKFDCNAPSSRHASVGANAARDLLEPGGAFRLEETDAIVRAIEVHSSKSAIHDALSEALKDADTLASWAAAPGMELSLERQVRLDRCLNELGLRSGWDQESECPGISKDF